MALVSVIIPNYNHASFLRQRIDSVLKQTFQDFEVIILDDCSSDTSKDVIESYRLDEKISRIIYNDMNCGSPFLQWERGFDVAQGKYIWIAESDDWADEFFLENLVPELECDDKISFAFSDSIIVYEDHVENNPACNRDFTEEGIHFAKTRMILENVVVNASAVVFRKSALNWIGKDYRSYRSAGDYMFWLEMCKQGKVFYKNKPLNFFRRDVNCVTLTNIKSGKSDEETYAVFFKMQNIFQLNFWEKQMSIYYHLWILKYYYKHGRITYESLKLVEKKWRQDRVLFPILALLVYLRIALQIKKNRNISLCYYVFFLMKSFFMVKKNQ